MVGIYFSDTGNSRYAVKLFCNEYDETTKSFSIEDDNIIEAVRNEEILVFPAKSKFAAIADDVNKGATQVAM